jgi:hypothetical protein
MKTATFALIFGIAYLVAGLLGLIPAALRPPPADAPPTQFTMLYGYLLGLFPVNALHNLVHIVWGLYGIIAYRSFAGARGFARASAVVYAVLTILGLIPGLNTMFGLVPLYGNDIWLHALITIAAAYFGFFAPERVEDRTTTTTTTRRI